MDDEILDATEVARLLHVHPRTVKAWAKAGRLRTLLIGRRYRFRRSDVLALFGQASGGKYASPVMRENLAAMSEKRRTKASTAERASA